MTHKPKATSNDGMQKALQDVRAGPLQSPWPLSRKQKPVWDEIMIQRARDEWQTIDLRFAFELAGALVELHEEQVKLVSEGSVIEGPTGPKANPRGKIVDQLGKRCASLSRYLRIHPAAAGYEPSSFTGRRKAEQEARAILDADGNLFLPKH